MRKSAPPSLGSPVSHKPGQWVQTERKAHEAWAQLISRKPRAAEALHHLVAHMGSQNAVVMPQKVLAALMGKSLDTAQRAIRDLAAERWIQIVRIGKGKEAAYVINDQVAWGQPREQLRLSAFSATIIADAADQDGLTLDQAPLRQIPTLYPGERQLPSGDGLPPPAQPFLDRMEPDLPSAKRPDPEPDQMDIETYLACRDPD
jgi:hypothetical protein